MLSFFPRDVLDEILNLIESVSEGFPSYFCSEKKDYRVHRAELKGQLRRRGYSRKFLEGELQKVDKLKREDLLAYKEKPKVNNKRVP